MLSTSVIKNGAEACHYFSAADNYYTQKDGIEHSEWYGKGAVALGLQGKVDLKLFTDLLAGHMPTGELLGKVVDGKVKHRAGWDLTFSAPKSVSLLALIGQDQRLIEAHRKAVKVALSYIEEGCAQARTKTREGIHYQNTGNIVAALYHHDLSRALDPQLHTHSVVMNMTERSDGKWRSQASQINRYDTNTLTEVNGFIERTRHHKRYFGKVYEAELAYQVKALGYDIFINEKTGVFEIAGVPEASRKFFSKRRDQVEKALAEQGLTSAKSADLLTLKTRTSKKSINREDLLYQWKQEAAMLNLDCKIIIEKALNKNKATPIKQHSLLEPERRAVLAVKQSIESLSRYKTTFTLEEVVTLALDYGLYEPLPISSVLKAIENASQMGGLIRIDHPSRKTVFMSKDTLQDEKRLFNCIAANLRDRPYIEEKKLKQFFEENVSLAIQQQTDLKTIFGNERMILLEGTLAKDTFVKPILQMAKAEKLSVMVLGPHQVGSLHFAKEMTPKPSNFYESIRSLFVDPITKNRSVMQFLSHYQAGNIRTSQLPDILLVDHAHLLSTHQKANIAEWNLKHDTKLILLGDKTTLLPLQTGTSLESLIAKGIKTITLNGSALVSALSGKEKIRDGIQKIAGHVIEVKDPYDRWQAMVAHFVKFSEEAMQEVWLTSPQKNAIAFLNQSAHLELKKNGKLGKSLYTNVLIPVFIPEGKLSHASSYQKDQSIRFNEGLKSLSIRRGEYVKVLDHHKEKNFVMLEKPNGKRVLWHPDQVTGTTASYVELFNQTYRELSVGESIVILRSIKSRHVMKGERLTITAIHNQTLKLKSKSGQFIYLDLNQEHHRHIDYGYAATLHAIAHEKPQMILADMPSFASKTNQRQLEQLLTQPAHTTIYTEDLKGLANALEKRTGDRLSAHEIIEKSNEAKKNIKDLYHLLEKEMLLCSQKTNDKPLARASLDAIDYAIHHLAEREAGFTHKQVIETAMQHALGNVRMEDLKQAVRAIENAGILLRGKREDGTLWTTLDAMKMEREIIALCQKDKGKLGPIATAALLEHYCDPTLLKPEQIDTLKAITQSPDRVIAVQGYAGTGKTTMLATLSAMLLAKESVDKEGYQLLGLSPTHKAVNELKKRGITAQTLDSFILKCQNDKEKGLLADRKFILVVDEASMLSNRKALAILTIVHELNSRMILVGDSRQLPAVEAGKPFGLAQYSVETKHLIDIKRQADGTLKQAVKETIQYDFKGAFKTLKNSIIEINARTHPLDESINKNDREQVREALRHKRLDVLVTDYFSYLKEGKDAIQIITPAHEDRVLVNERIRDQLKAKGDLGPAYDQTCPILRAESFTQIERAQITEFRVGHVLRFAKNEAVGIKSGEYLTVVNRLLHHRLLMLKNQEGREFIWEVPLFDKSRLSRIEVFKKEERSLQKGDLIRWTRSNKQHGLVSTEPATVYSIERNKITVLLTNQKPFTFDSNDPNFQHWDHGYAATVYGVQADTKRIVLVYLESHRKNLASQPSFLVSLTRAVDVFKLYTDSARLLLQRIEENTGLKLSGLEVVGEGPYDKKNAFQKWVHPPKMARPSNVSNVLNPLTPRPFVQALRAPSFKRDTVNRIKEGLNQCAEEIAIEILGKPKERGGHYLKFGSRQGSLSITIKGEKQGWFNDFETHVGGRDMLKFLQVYANLNRHEALQYGARWLGILSSSQKKTSTKRAHPVYLQTETKGEASQTHTFSDYEKRQIKKANQLADESIPIKATLAEKYLKEHRGIETEVWSDDLRYHPGIYAKQNQQAFPALLSIARNSQGNVQSVEALFLDPKSADKANVPLKKQTIGPKKGLNVSLNHVKDKEAPTLLAEGIVTGLSLASALPKTNVRVVMGKQMFLSVDPSSLTDKVIFCLDNDGKNLRTEATILRAANRLKAHQKEVYFMVPNGLKSLKQDYNDILKQKGKEAIQRDFQKAASFDEFYKNQDGLPENSVSLPAPKLIKHILKREMPKLQTIQNNPNSTPSISDRQIAHFNKEAKRIAYQISQSKHHYAKGMVQQLRQTEPSQSVCTRQDIEREI